MFKFVVYSPVQFYAVVSTYKHSLKQKCHKYTLEVIDLVYTWNIYTIYSLKDIEIIQRK